MEDFVIVGMAVLILAVLIRLGAGDLDQGRIREYIAAHNGRILEICWAPLGPGWIGDRSGRIYQVRYVDADGNRHRAYCKTSLGSGVYLTGDTIEELGAHAPAPQTDRSWLALREENRRLRTQLNDLKEQRD